MNGFFTNFNTVAYNFDGENQNYTLMTNFTQSVVFRELSNILQYNKYYIGDSDTPDNLAYTIYGKSDKHWLFYLINPELKNGWPLSNSELDSHVENLYGKYTFLALDVESIPNLKIYNFPPLISEYYKNTLYKNIEVYRKVGNNYVLISDDIIFYGSDETRKGLIINFISSMINDNSIYLKFVDSQLSSTIPESAKELWATYSDDLVGGYLPIDLQISRSRQFFKNTIYEYENMSYYDGIMNNAIQNAITFEEYIIKSNESRKIIKVIDRSDVDRVERAYFNILNNNV